MSVKSWFKMSALPLAEGETVKNGEPGSVARIDITGPIGGWDVSGSDFLAELKSLGEIDSIDLRIHSPGGEVLDGWAIANGLMRHPARVTARIEGQACSMASVVALAADEVQIPENGYLMIHNVSGGAFGGSDDLRDVADLIDKLGDDIVEFYAARTGIDAGEIRTMMAAETWMNGREAVEKGFAHTLMETVKAAACLDDWKVENRFDHVPEDLVMEEEEEEEEGGEVEEPSAWKNLLARLGMTPEGATEKKATNRGGELVARIESLTGEVESLKGELASAKNERDEAKAEAAKFTAAVMMMEAEAKSVAAVLAEHGFDCAATEDLPEPVSKEGAEKSGASILDELEAMPRGEARREFYKAHESAILRAYSDKNKAG
jgi:ATP-dependent protease ClpP protease subunit